MSYSSLWGVNKYFYGTELIQFQNSCIFSNIIMDTLYHKYIPENIHATYSEESIFFIDSDIDPNLFRKLDGLISNSGDNGDMTLWILANQQIMPTTCKEYIAKCIVEFTKYIQESHMVDRFVSVAEEILGLDEEVYPYFIIKITNVDNSVNSWFNNSSLLELKEDVTNFVIMENNQVTDIISNTVYTKDLKETVTDVQTSATEYYVVQRLGTTYYDKKIAWRDVYEQSNLRDKNEAMRWARKFTRKAYFNKTDERFRVVKRTVEKVVTSIATVEEYIEPFEG